MEEADVLCGFKSFMFLVGMFPIEILLLTKTACMNRHFILFEENRVSGSCKSKISASHLSANEKEKRSKLFARGSLT
jgi:hypothetical protein